MHRPLTNVGGDLGFEILKAVWNNRKNLGVNKISIDKLLNLKETKQIIKDHPALSMEFLERIFQQMLRAVCTLYTYLCVCMCACMPVCIMYVLCIHVCMYMCVILCIYVYVCVQCA